MIIFQHNQITIETLPPMHVGCLRIVSPSPETDCSQKLHAWLVQQAVSGPVRTFGFDTETTPAEAQAGKRGYEIWATLPPGIEPSEDVTVQDFKGGQYAVMTLICPFTNPFETIPAGWKFLHEWVIGSGQYQGGNHQWLEELIEMSDGHNLKLYHPIVSSI